MGLSTWSRLSLAAGAVRVWAEPLEHRVLLSGSYVEDELLVQYRPGATEHEIAEVRSLLDADLKERLGGHAADARERRRGERRWGSGAVDVLSLPAGMSVATAIERVGSHSAVSSAEANLITALALTPNDPSFGQLWALHNAGRKGSTANADIDAPEGWNITTGSSDVVVFVIDTGVDYSHPDLASNMWRNPFEIPGNGIDDEGNGYVDDVHGIDTFNGDSDPRDDNGHGTHVAGTIGARGNNGLGVVGVNWDVKIGACKSHSASGSSTLDSLVECFQYVNDLKLRGVNVVVTNNSWAGVAGPGQSAPFAGGIIRQLMDGPAGMAKILHAVAAGNDGVDNDSVLHPVTWPASWNLDNIISVAASDSKDQVAGFSSWGATTVDLAAPGVGIYSTVRNGGYGSMGGTSMATPHVAGAAALVAAARPGMPAEAIKQALMDTTDFIGNVGSNASKPTATQGRLNVHKALLLVTENDGTAPAAVADLAVSLAGAWSVRLAWTASGDDGLSGTARAYDVRYSTSPITEENWAFASSAVVEPRARVSGQAEAFRVQRLPYDTAYYFALKVRDGVGNESALSNVAAASTSVATAAFSDDFESGLGQWTAQAPWGLTSAARRSGEFSVADSPGGNYASNVDTSLTSIPIDLTQIADAHLVFYSRGESEFATDYLRVQVSADDGGTWATLSSLQGFADAFTQYTADLSAYDGKASLRVRFRFQSNGSVNADGRYVDDVAVVGKAIDPDTSPPPTAVPAAPSGLTASPLSSRRVRLDWADHSEDETGFHVWSSRDDVNWTLTATMAANATSYTTGSLARGTWYFRVSAFNDAGASLLTGVVSVSV